jgi:hypothetical protein
VHTFHYKKNKNYAGQMILSCFSNACSSFMIFLIVVVITMAASRLLLALHLFPYTAICHYGLGFYICPVRSEESVIHAVALNRMYHAALTKNCCESDTSYPFY